MKKELIEEIHTIINSMQRIAEILEEGEETVDEVSPKEEELTTEVIPNEKEVTQLIKKMGIPAHLLGYNYLRTGIMIALENPDVLKLITKELYPQIAKVYNTVPHRIECAIRHAIKVSMSRIDYDFYQEVFESSVSLDKGKPTNWQYISALVDYIKRK